MALSAFWLSFFSTRSPLSPPFPFSSLPVNLFVCSGLWRTVRELITGWICVSPFASPLLSSWPPLSPSSLFSSLYNSSSKQKPRSRRLHSWILPKISRRVNTYPTQTLPENCRGRSTSKLIPWGHHHPNTKTWQRCHKKRKLQANISDEYRCKNP